MITFIAKKLQAFWKSKAPQPSNLNSSAFEPEYRAAEIIPNYKNRREMQEAVPPTATKKPLRRTVRASGRVDILPLRRSVPGGSFGVHPEDSRARDHYSDYLILSTAFGHYPVPACPSTFGGQGGSFGGAGATGDWSNPRDIILPADVASSSSRSSGSSSSSSSDSSSPSPYFGSSSSSSYFGSSSSSSYFGSSSSSSDSSSSDSSSYSE